MKVMLTLAVLGLGFLATGLSIEAGMLSIDCDRLMFGLASATLISAGIAGFIYAWQNRPSNSRRLRKGRRG
jgi:hypothetical protein